MQKIVIESAGGYEKLVMQTLPDPAPEKLGDDEVLVKTISIGVNYADCCVRWGVYESAKKYVGWPITPGFEFSGIVTGIGKNVRNVSLGSKVVGATRFGGYSTHIILPSHQVFILPLNLDITQAGGFLAVFITAYHALFQSIRVRPGMTVLVHSAAGGVGSALLQLGKIAGCKMVGVVGSSHKVKAAQELGADIVIDKSKVDLWEAVEKIAPEGFDIILDSSGHETLSKGYNHLAPCGKLITYGFATMLPKEGGRINYLKSAWGLLCIPRFNPMKLCTENKGIVGFNISFLFNRKDLLNEAVPELIKWWAEGKIEMPKVTTFPFEKVGDAHRLIESGKSIGKLVLIP